MPKQRSATRESAQARLEKRASLPRGVRKTKQPASSTNPGSPDPYVTVRPRTPDTPRPQRRSLPRAAKKSIPARRVRWADDVSGELEGFSIVPNQDDTRTLTPQVQPASIGADRAASAFGIQTPGQPDLDLDFNVDAPAQHPHSGITPPLGPTDVFSGPCSAQVAGCDELDQTDGHYTGLTQRCGGLHDQTWNVCVGCRSTQSWTHHSAEKQAVDGFQLPICKPCADMAVPTSCECASLPGKVWLCNVCRSAKLLSLRNQARNEAHKLLQGTWVPGTCAGCGAALDWEVKARVCVLCKAVKHINLQASPTVTDTNDPSSLDTSVHAPPEAINTEAIWGQYAFPGTIDETTGDIDHPLARDAVLEAEGTFIGSPRPPAAHHSEQESAFDEFMSVEQQAFLADFINAPGAAVSTILTDGVEDVDALPSFPFPDTGDDCPTQEDWDWLNSDGL